MCGRYTLFKLADLLKLIPWLQAPAEILEREARYNVAPSQMMPNITVKDVHLAQWGRCHYIQNGGSSGMARTRIGSIAWEAAMSIVRLMQRWLKIALLIGTLTLPSAASAGAQTEYRMVRLIDIRPSTSSVASGIDKGIAVGDSPGLTAVAWPAPDQYYDLTPRQPGPAASPRGYYLASAFGISGGQIVGAAFESGGALHAMVWNGLAPIDAIDLTPTLPPGLRMAQALATDGTYQVGTTTERDKLEAVAWKGGPDSEMLIGDRFAMSAAYGVYGGIAVGYGWPGQGYDHAIAWNLAEGSMVDLNPPNQQASHAFGISHGQVVGYVYDGLNLLGTRAGYWSSVDPGSFVNLDPGGTLASYAWATNGRQQVGGVALSLDPVTHLPDEHAVVWSGSANSVQYLPVPQGTTFSRALGIDGNGVIVGGVDGAAVEWVPVPEPATLELLALVIGCWVIRRQRSI